MTTSISLHKYDATACIIFMEPHSMWLGVAESTSHSQLGGRGACSPDEELANSRRRRDISLDAYCNIFDLKTLHYVLLRCSKHSQIVLYHIRNKIARLFLKKFNLCNFFETTIKQGRIFYWSGYNNLANLLYHF